MPIPINVIAVGKMGSRSQASGCVQSGANPAVRVRCLSNQQTNVYKKEKLLLPVDHQTRRRGQNGGGATRRVYFS